MEAVNSGEPRPRGSDLAREAVAPSAVQLWRGALDRLRRVIPAPSFETWLEETRALDLQDGVLRVGVASDFAREALTNQFYPAIEDVLAGAAGQRLKIEFVVQPREPATAGDPARPLKGADQPPVGRSRPVLAPHNTFDTYIVGRSNRLAHAAAVAVSELPGRAYNPLFIYGGVGLGKTHLLQAIGHVTAPQVQTLYLSTEAYTNEFVTALREHRMERFRQKFRNVDVLLIDDIQFISRGEQTQEEFFHTFDALHGLGKQIVISSDVSPKLLTSLEERLRSRFEWGLIVDIAPPDVETRLAILRSRAERGGLAVPEEVLLLIAHRVQDNIRQLEGALNRVAALARLYRQPISRELAGEALNAITATPRTAVPLPNVVLETVAQCTNVPVEALTSSRREKQVTYARHLAMYLLRDVSHQSYAQIGRLLGGRDHTTVLHGFRRIEKLLDSDPDVRRSLLEIRAAIAAR